MCNLEYRNQKSHVMNGTHCADVSGLGKCPGNARNPPSPQIVRTLLHCLLSQKVLHKIMAGNSRALQNAHGEKESLLCHKNRKKTRLLFSSYTFPKNFLRPPNAVLKKILALVSFSILVKSTFFFFLPSRHLKSTEFSFSS